MFEHRKWMPMTAYHGQVVLRELVDACGPGYARQAGLMDRVGQRQGRWVAAPPDVPGVARVLGVAAEHGLSVVVCGAGTKLDWGTPPSRVDVLLDTGRLAGIELDPPNQEPDPNADPDAGPPAGPVTVAAGTPLRAVRAAVTRAGRRLPLDVGSPAATVGGVLATNEAGPLRLTFGAPRDQLVDLEYVAADGVVSRADGPAGPAGRTPGRTGTSFDAARLLCDSYGTLGVITKATLRVSRSPAARAWVTRSVRTPLEMFELTSNLLAAPRTPVAIEVDLPPRFGREGLAPRQRSPRYNGDLGELAVLVEGEPEQVAGQREQVRRLIGGNATGHPAPPDWWGRYPFGPDDIALRLAVPVTSLHAVLYALHDATGAAVPVRGSAGVGVVFAALPGHTAPERVADIVAAVRTTLLARGGSCLVLRAPDRVREALPKGGGPASGGADPAERTISELPLLQRVKERFDPDGRFAPGRLPGGR